MRPQGEDNHDDKADRETRHNRQILRALALFTQLGISMAACVFVGVVIGKLLDGWLNTSPWLLIVFSILGGLAAFKTMYEIVMKEWM